MGCTLDGVAPDNKAVWMSETRETNEEGVEERNVDEDAKRNGIERGREGENGRRRGDRVARDTSRGRVHTR